MEYRLEIVARETTADGRWYFLSVSGNRTTWYQAVVTKEQIPTEITRIVERVMGYRTGGQ